MVLFSKYGAVDSVSSYPSRSYAFVYFKRVEDAKKALEALHGTYLRGNSLKIEFARPVCSALRALLGFTDCSLCLLIDWLCCVVIGVITVFMCLNVEFVASELKKRSFVGMGVIYVGSYSSLRLGTVLVPRSKFHFTMSSQETRDYLFSGEDVSYTR